MSKKQDDNILEELSNANVEKVYERYTASYDSNKDLSIDNDDKAKELEKADSLSPEASESENIISDNKSSEEIEEDMTIKLDKNFNDFEDENRNISTFYFSSISTTCCNNAGILWLEFLIV